MARDKHATKVKAHQKKGWFKRLLERIAKANQETGGEICAA
jgi:hypothetical protein